MNTITPLELNKLLTRQPDMVVFDVRTPAEYSGAHVSQAVNIPLDEFNLRAIGQSGVVPAERNIYILCQAGGRAAKAVEKLRGEGFPHGVVVEGGTSAWIDAGFPVKQGSVSVISLERQVRIAAGLLVLTGVLLAWLVNPVFIGLSAFVGAGLVFAGITDFCGMGLLLAKLPWNQRKSA